jgi:hypothetical protein
MAEPTDRPLLGWASFTIPPSKIFRLFDHVKQNQNWSKYFSLNSGA